MGAYLILWWYTAGDTFCQRSGSGHFVISARLTVGFTIWYLLVLCLCSLVADRGVRALLTATIVGLGIASIPFWLYRGYGHFLLENTAADVSCAFTEGFGMGFPVVIGPFFCALSLGCEWIAGKLNKISPQTK